MAEFMEKYFGDAEGMTKEDRVKKFPDRMYPNQEKTPMLRKRVMDGINKIHTNYQGLNVLVVAHGGVINAILYELSKGEIGSGKTVLTNGGITTIIFKNDQWEIGQVNNAEHLSHWSEKGKFNSGGI